MKYKGKEIPPYESFYWNDSEDFFRGFLGGGISRTVKCDDFLAVIVEYEQETTEDDHEQPHPQQGGVFIDAYNQTINTEIAGTITTRVDASSMVYVTEIIPLNTDKDGNCSCLKANYHKMGGVNFLSHTNDGFKATCIMEINKINKIGNYSPSGHNASSIVDTEGIAPAVMENHGTVTAIVEPKAISYTRDKDGSVTDRHLNDVFNTIHSGTGGGGNTDCYIAEPMCSVHPLSHAKEFNPETNIKTISPALRTTDYKCPHCVYEPRVMQIGNLYPNTDNFKNRTMGHVYSADGLSPTINCCGGGDREPKVLRPRRTDFGKSIRKQYESHQVDMSRHDMTQLEPREDGISNTITTIQKDNLLAEPLLIPEATTKGYAEAYDGDSVNLALPNSKTRRGRVGHQQANTLDTSCNQGVVANYRIRKLTPRECFRLMDVSEPDIDKLLNAGISNSQLYKLAGNSIVCSVIYHVLRKMFIEKENENQQLTLF